jgi:transposase
MVQVRRPSPGQTYYRRKLAEGKAPKEALRCLRRRLSDAVYRCLLAANTTHPWARSPTADDPGGYRCGTSHDRK